MVFAFAIEASKPCGSCYRLAVGIRFPFPLVWIASQLARLL